MKPKFTAPLSLLISYILLLSCQESKPKKDYYAEKHRPQFHFSPEANWMNDPNGMVYYEGEYHLFYQYYPDSTVWGPMHWGHAVSNNLVHWQHLPIALYPDSLGYIFSGSAVIDWNNTSSFGKGNKPPMIAIFTHHDMDGEKSGRTDYQYQSIAYSNDNGRTWTKYKHNPVIGNAKKLRNYRDPKVSWDEKSEQWLMPFAVEDHIEIWASKNLKEWTFLSNFGKGFGTHEGVWECPDLFPMQVENTDEVKYVLIQNINPGGKNGGSGTQYFIGNFDGKTFLVDEGFSKDVTNEKAVWFDHGHDNYAGVTWSDIPKSDSRRIFLGWMSNWKYAQVVPTEKWRSAMTIPRTLSLIKRKNTYRLVQKPVKELKALRGKGQVRKNIKIDKEQSIFKSQQGIETILKIDLSKTTSSRIGIELSNHLGEKYVFSYNLNDKLYTSYRKESGQNTFSPTFTEKNAFAKRTNDKDTLNIHLFMDDASVEIFTNEYEIVFTEIFFPNQKFNTLKLINLDNNDKEIYLTEVRSYSLKSIWR